MKRTDLVLTSGALMLLLMIITASGCCRRDTNADMDSMIAADQAFSRVSLKKGMNAAFIQYAADSVVKLRDGRFPIIGKDALAKIYLTRPDSGLSLQWAPTRAEIAASGELGYTFGDWELKVKAKDTVMYGNYVTIWKKQSDGSWKYILDAGSNTPKPVK